MKLTKTNNITKKIIHLFLILLLLLACTISKYDAIYIASSLIQLSKKDASDVYAFLKKTIKDDTSKLNPEDKPLGGQTISICVEKNGNTTQYAFLLDNLYVFEASENPKEYKINHDYYENEFYPFLSKICDQYFPVYYQITNCSKHLSITKKKDDETKELKREDILRLALNIAYNYTSAIPLETFDNELYQIIVDDGIVKEIIHCFDGYVVINNHKIILPEDFSLQC